jgi:hypothetical protein
MQSFLAIFIIAVRLAGTGLPPPSAADAALAAAKRFTWTSIILREEVGVTILFDSTSGAYSYGSHVHYGQGAITIDASDPTDVPPGCVLVGIWHAHPNAPDDSLSGHISEIQKHKSIEIFTSYEGELVTQFWDPALNEGRGGVHDPVNICPGGHTCMPFPNE